MRSYKTFQNNIGPIPTSIGDNINYRSILYKAKGHLAIARKIYTMNKYIPSMPTQGIVWEFLQYLQPKLSDYNINNLTDVMLALTETISSAEQALIYIL